MNHTLRKTLAKLWQETQEPWTSLLPIAVLKVCVSLRSDLRLSPFEMTYRRPFLTTDILVNEDMNQALRYIICLGQVHKQPRTVPTRHCQLPLKIHRKEQFLHKETPGTKFFLKPGKGFPQPTTVKREGPYSNLNHPHCCETERERVYLSRLRILPPETPTQENRTSVSQWKI